MEANIIQFIINFFKYILPGITTFTWIQFFGGSYKALKLGRTDKEYAILKESLTVKDKLFKLRYVSLTKEGKKFQWFFVIMTYCGYITLFAWNVIFWISRFTHNYTEMFQVFLFIKCYTFEIYAFIFTAKHTVRPPSGVGIDWDFVYYKKH